MKKKMKKKKMKMNTEMSFETLNNTKKSADEDERNLKKFDMNALIASEIKKTCIMIFNN